MSVATLSLFRFDGVANRFWAIRQMQAARRPLRQTPEIGFFKLLGSGTGEGFTPKPNFGVWGLLATWSSVESAANGVGGHPVFERFRDHAAESWTLTMAARRCWGRWSGVAPFPVREEIGDAPPHAILTRATLKPRIAGRFWRRVPDISQAIGANRDVRFKIGLGEVPLLHQVTFSIWPDLDSMKRFAYGDGPHQQAVSAVRAEGWFREELYARFAVLRSEGSWNGVDPIKADPAQGRDTSTIRAA